MVEFIDRCIATPDICFPNPTIVEILGSIMNSPYYAVLSPIFAFIAILANTAYRTIKAPDIGAVIRYVMAAIFFFILFVPSQWIDQNGNTRGLGFGTRTTIKVGFDPESVRKAMENQGLMAVQGFEKKREVVMPLGLWLIVKSTNLVQNVVALMVERTVGGIDPMFKRAAGFITGGGLDLVTVDTPPNPTNFLKENTKMVAGEAFYGLEQETGGKTNGTNVVKAFLESSSGSVEHRLFTAMISKLGLKPMDMLPPITDRISEMAKNSTSVDDFRQECRSKIFAPIKEDENKKIEESREIANSATFYAWVVAVLAGAVLTPLSIFLLWEAFKKGGFQELIYIALSLLLGTALLVLSFPLYDAWKGSLPSSSPTTTFSGSDLPTRSEVIWCRIMTEEIPFGVYGLSQPVTIFDIYKKIREDSGFSGSVDRSLYGQAKLSLNFDSNRNYMIAAFSLAGIFSSYEDVLQFYLKNKDRSFLSKAVSGLTDYVLSLIQQMENFTLTLVATLGSLLMTAILKLVVYAAHLAIAAYLTVLIAFYPIVVLIESLEGISV